MNQYKGLALHITALLFTLSCMETVHLIYVLNPNLPVTTGTFLISGIKVGLVFLVPFTLLFGIIKRWPGITPMVWILVPVLVCLLFAGHYFAGGTFLDPELAKIFLKEIYALALLCLTMIPLAFLLRHGPRQPLLYAWAILLLVHIYQYDRRDAWKVYRTPASVLPATIEPTVRTFMILTSPFAYDSLLEVTHARSTPGPSRLFEEGSRGRIVPMIPRETASAWASLYTGAYPYRHRIFGSYARNDILFPTEDLFPLYWPSFFLTRAPKPLVSATKVPAIWQMAQSSSLSCALYHLPFLDSPPEDISRAVTLQGSVPRDMPPETSPSEFLDQNPASLVIVYTESGENGAVLDRVVTAALSIASDLDEILVIDPVAGRWFLHWGYGVAAGGTTAEARVVDMVPTILYVHRIPIPRSVDGRVLLENFTPEYRSTRTITVITGRP